MGREFYLVYSPSKDSLLTVRKNIQDCVRDKKYAYEGPVDLKPVPTDVAWQILRREPIDDPLHGWLRDANKHRVDVLLLDHSPEHLWGTVFVVADRHTNAGNHIQNCVHREDVQLVKRASKSAKRVPYSYDPSITYVTEPETW